MTKKSSHLDLIERMYHDLPAFTDIFTEETFYIFAVCFVLSTILVAFILSRYVTIKPVEM